MVPPCLVFQWVGSVGLLSSVMSWSNLLVWHDESIDLVEQLCAMFSVSVGVRGLLVCWLVSVLAAVPVTSHARSRPIEKNNSEHKQFHASTELWTISPCKMRPCECLCLYLKEVFACGCGSPPACADCGCLLLNRLQVRYEVPFKFDLSSLVFSLSPSAVVFMVFWVCFAF